MRSANIAIDDWAFRYGWGLFETIRIREHSPLFLEKHVHRLCGASVLLELGSNSDAECDRWQREITKAVRLSKSREGIVNCYWTRGSHLSDVQPSRIIRIRPMPRYPRRPLKLWIAPWRIEPTYPGSGAKTLAYFPYIYAGLAARRSGFDEAIVLNTRDRVADGAASSIFIVRNGRLATPSLDQGTLAGVTRSVVLEIVQELGLRCREMAVTWKSLLEADEVFVTSSLRGVVPVSKISDDWSAKRVDKSVTKQIRSAYLSQVSESVRHYQKMC